MSLPYPVPDWIEVNFERGDLYDTIQLKYFDRKLMRVYGVSIAGIEKHDPLLAKKWVYALEVICYSKEVNKRDEFAAWYLANSSEFEAKK